MKHATLFSLSLFLAFPIAIECMEKEIVFQPKTMQEIRDERSKIYEKLLDKERENQLDSELRKYDRYLRYDCDFVANYICFQEDPTRLLESALYSHIFQIPILGEYSCLSLAIIAIQRPNFVADYDRWGQMVNYNLIQHPKQAPFQEKKENVQKFLTIVKPTEKDKYLALLTKNEEFGPVIIKKMLLLQDILLLLETDARQEFIKNISLLMFEMEESLL